MRDAGSGSETKSGLTNCNRRVWTPSKQMNTWVCPSMPAATQPQPKFSTAWALPTSNCSRITPIRFPSCKPTAYMSPNVSVLSLDDTRKMPITSRPKPPNSITSSRQNRTIMAKHGAPQLHVDATDYRVAIIAGSWHTTVMNGLIAGARTALESSGATHKLITVAGSFEIPLAAQTALANGYDAVVCLGVIIRGDTPHFDFVADAVTSGLTRVQLDAGKP